MDRLPTLRAREMLGGLYNLGFEFDHQRGSHIILKHLDGRWATVPYHGSRDLDRRLVRRILKQAQVPVADFLAAL